MHWGLKIVELRATDCWPSTNGDGIPVSKFADVFSAVGLEQYAFTPSGALSLDQWPTLQTMINDGTRLVIWMGRFMEHTYFRPCPAGSSSLMR